MMWLRPQAVTLGMVFVTQPQLLVRGWASLKTLLSHPLPAKVGQLRTDFLQVLTLLY